MPFKSPKERILIIGASGFVGQIIYKEFANFYQVYGTYCSQISWATKKNFFYYNSPHSSLSHLLHQVKPSIIISSFREQKNNTDAHDELVLYVKQYDAKIIFLSSANVFDAYSKYPSYELDKTFTNSIYGYYKIKIENTLMSLPPHQFAILRMPMIFGRNCPRIKKIKEEIKHQTPIEVFPNTIMNIALDTHVAWQIHYIVNRNKEGIFHLGSSDLIYHDDFLSTLTQKITNQVVHFKRVYATNADRYIAVLPKYNTLPKHFNITIPKILDYLSMNAEKNTI